MKVLNAKMLDSGFDEFSKSPELDYNLAYAAVLGLSKDTSKLHINDYSLRRQVNRGTTLALRLRLRNT